MADVKLSALPVVTTSAAADSIPIVQGGVTSRIHPGPGGGLDADTVSGAGITAGKKVWTTTGTGGDDGNGGQPPVGKGTPYTAASVVNTGTWNVVTFGASDAVFMANVWQTGGTSYAGWCIVRKSSNGNAYISTNAVVAGLTFSVSGATLVVTNTSGSALNLTCAINQLY